METGFELGCVVSYLVVQTLDEGSPYKQNVTHMNVVSAMIHRKQAKRTIHQLHIFFYVLRVISFSLSWSAVQKKN